MALVICVSPVGAVRFDTFFARAGIPVCEETVQSKLAKPECSLEVFQRSQVVCTGIEIKVRQYRIQRLLNRQWPVSYTHLTLPTKA